jgi:hypothetical protein
MLGAMWFPQGKSSEELGTEILCDIVNANLLGVTEQLVPAPGGVTRRVRAFRSLVDVAYWHLARLAASSQLAECDECGALFERTDGRQRFCPPPHWLDPDGHKKGPKESLCAKRARMRRLRKHQ